jgi:cytochrome c biogenesis protein CcmG, thiol:disulfide interchange protein DsbE
MSYHRIKAARIARGVTLAALAIAAIYAFSPTVRNQFGSVKPLNQRAAPISDLRATALDGTRWSLSEQMGKVVLVNFWATWCPPCRIETPALVALHNKFSSRGFTVIGVTLDDDPAASVPAFVSEYAMTYPVVVPSENSLLLDSVQALPTTLLIDRSGRVARTYRGMVTERGLTDDIEALLAEQGSTI